jgi:hypothetical protein
MSELGPKEDLGTERDILRVKLKMDFGDLMCRARSMVLWWVYIEVGCCLVILAFQVVALKEVLCGGGWGTNT